MNVLGLDIGGVNLKAADGRGWALSRPLPLWQEPAALGPALAELIAAAPPAAGGLLAVTMTGELADCFRTKAEGVKFILAAVERAAGGRRVLIYGVDGRFVPPAEVRQAPERAAASNWHALATFVARQITPRPAVLIDIGSTTTDIIPLADGRPATGSRTDTDRLLRGELVYSGVGRTPVCAVVDSLPWRGQRCPVAAELFATTADAYVLLGEVVEDPTDWATADGRPRTAEFARERLARMICADGTSFDAADARVAAEAVRAAQVGRLRESLSRVLGGMEWPAEEVVISGAGEFLARGVLSGLGGGRPVISLAERIGGPASGCAPAHAVAMLAADRRAQKSPEYGPVLRCVNFWELEK